MKGLQEKMTLHQIGEVALIFLLIIVFITALAVSIGWKFHSLLNTLKQVIKLEIRSPSGRVSLVVNLLTAVLFLILFTSHEALALVKAFIKPELEASSLNFNFVFFTVALMFGGNLFVLAYLEGKKQRLVARRDAEVSGQQDNITPN
jgi:hypothetical protein